MMLRSGVRTIGTGSRQGLLRQRSAARGMASSAASSASASEQEPPPRRIFSGIQPTGVPHLGNYLGALRNWVDLQASARAGVDDVVLSVVGLHAITMPQDPKRLRKERNEMMAALLAVGIDPERSTLFHQEQVPEHAELAWILNCLTSMGRLNRMTTWKGKLATAKGNGSSEESSDVGSLSLGLFAYPVLQAADILLYRSTHVPVGEDQVQHLELARDIAQLFNRDYKTRLFPPPQHLITPTKRVLSLRDPSQKMSKSAPDINSRILLTDTPAEVSRKLKRAVTDEDVSLSYDPFTRPGVSNLLLILSALRAGSGGPALEAQRLNDLGGGAGRLKKAVEEAVIETLLPIQERMKKYAAEPAYLASVEAKGREKARQRAMPTMDAVRKLVGFM